MAVEVFIEGVEQLDGEGRTLAHFGAVTPRLSRPSQGWFKVPMDAATGDVGDKCQVWIDDVFALHGRCQSWEVDTNEDVGYVQYNVATPMEIWEKRPVRDADGDFSKPSIIETFQTGPQILEAMLTHSEFAGGGPPADCEGPLRQQLGSFALGGVSLEGAPTDWPMTIAELASLLVSTGQLDIVETMIDVAGNMTRVDAYNGDFGTDRTVGSDAISFDYGQGNFNVKNLRWNRTLERLSNKIWYYLGPRVQTEADPAGDQHWRANIVSTDPGLSDPPLTAVNARRVASQAAYDVRMDIQIYDARGDESTIGRELYRWLWLAESWLRAEPLDMAHLELVPGAFAFGDFNFGDLVAVSALPAAMGGFAAAQRIYEYTASWGEDSVVSITEVQTSPTNEGFA